MTDALHAFNARQCQRAVETLTKINSSAAISSLAEAFQSPDPFVQARATIARAVNGQIDTVPTLITLIADGRDDIDASDALTSLACHAHADTINKALTTCLEGSSDQSQQRLTAALGSIPGPLAEHALNHLTKDADRGVAATATFIIRNRNQIATT